MIDETRSTIAEHAYLAARADMEFRTNLTAARHYVENLLTAFSYAVCSRNALMLTGLTGTVAVSLDGDLQSGESKSERIIEWFAHSGLPTIQTITNISLGFGDGSALYSATYQDWESGPVPRCIAIGMYQGRLKAGPQVWRWEEHQVTKPTNRAYCRDAVHHFTSPPIRGQRSLQPAR